MAENLHKQPAKGILKNSKSFDKPDERRRSKAKFDEMNIIATLHPPDKDYGHMKIDEPKTPYNYEGETASNQDQLDADLLSEKLKVEGAESGPRALRGRRDSSTSFSSINDDDDDADLTPEEIARRKEFEMKRKKHYNTEFQRAMKLAKKHLEELEDEDEEEIETAAKDKKNVVESDEDVLDEQNNEEAASQEQKPMFQTDL